LFTTAPLLAELEDVLNRPKFLSKITQADATPRSLVLSYAALATIVKPASIDPVILEDPDDDAVLECAISADADVIVSGDSHLRRLEEYSNIRILSARQMMEQLSSIE